MKGDVVCAENELAMIINSVDKYMDFLVRSIESYVDILRDMQEKGLKDELLCTNLYNIALDITSYKGLLYTLTEQVRSDVNKYMDDVSNADKFEFPMDVMSIVLSILSKV